MQKITHEKVLFIENPKKKWKKDFFLHYGKRVTVLGGTPPFNERVYIISFLLLRFGWEKLFNY